MKKKKRKIEIIFNVQARREYLTGFHKRKLERQKKVEEFMKKQEKDKRLRISKNVKEKINIEIQKYIKSTSLITQGDFLNSENSIQNSQDFDVCDESKKNINIWQNKYDDQNYTTVTITEDLN
ncbi:hypothetical protein T552_00347 [Pneumocystis carinii B80]|uniref:Nucleolar protein 12 n=1 Tax=Pneumocystis carinii (strain B80) TaxID=1408658 RepID=A0A0W4ZQI6_PNEC8|nr:hypothetical protein T552_00347 [Pneumocystis carinii B80]KTW30631.1 hypothetical protein T552_00347 [Pneumocystis carinii B80]